MGLFEGLAPDGGSETIRKAVGILLDAREGEAPGRPWSLAELRPSEGDYTWLQEWGQALDHQTANRWLDAREAVDRPTRRFRGDAAIGLLLLFLFAEKARRDAREANLWSVLAHGLFGKQTEQRLFITGQSYPRPRVQHALEEAAHAFGLRNVFSQAADTHAYKGLIFLQFGFSIRGAEGNLPQWLAGLDTQGVRRLFRGALRSDSFRDCWSTLIDLRRGHLTRDAFKRRLQATPWVLPEWVHKLGDLAQSRKSLGTCGLDDEAVEDRPFLTDARVVWSRPDEPCLRVKFDADALALDEPGLYRLIVGGREIARVVVDGCEARLDPPGNQVRVPRVAPALPVVLRSEAGMPVATMDLEVWNADLDVVLCAWDGEAARPVGDAWETRMSLGRRYALLAGRDLELDPPAHDWCDLPGSAFRLSVLEDAWSEELTLRFQGDVVWRPLLAGRSAAFVPDWARRVSIRAIDPNNCVRVEHPADVAVRWARTPSGAVEVLRESGQTRIGPLPKGSARVTLGLACGDETATLRQDTHSNRTGAWLLREDGWQALDEVPEVDADHLASGRIKVELTNDQSQERDRWWVLEGSVTHRQLPRGTFTLPGASGLGAPLVLRRDRYNTVEADHTLGPNVVDRGHLEHVAASGTDWRLSLRNPTEPDDNFRVIWWGQDGSRQSLEPEPASPAEWRVSSLVSPLAVGLAYGGVRVGAWWADQWWEHLADLDVPDAGAMLRWLRLPLLSPHCAWAMQQFVRLAPATLLAAWLSETSQPPLDLAWAATASMAWANAIRKLYWDWEPELIEAATVVKKLGKGCEAPGDRLDKAGYRLADWHPLLMTRVLRPFAKQLAPAINALGNRLATDENELLTACCREMKPPDLEAADENFVKRGFLEKAVPIARGEKLDPNVERRLELAMPIRPFRQLLALRLLHELQRAA